VVTSEVEIRHGTKIGRFVVVGELGSGGMGVVYAAHDHQLDRQVALKVLRAAAATDEERMRMLREGQAMARVTHPNVITVYEVGVEGSLVFLAQELLDAGTLGKWLEQPRSQAEIIDKFVAAGRGLAAAHAAGLVHRDFKPDNVLLGKDGRVRVSDFGLARSLGPVDDGLPAATRANMARAQLDLSRSPMSPLTRTGAVMGTPMFMAPEQHNGDRADERSDQFSFSVALYRALYGEWPFAGKTAVALADAVIEGRMARPPRGHHVPARLRRILLRGLSTKPAARYPSMEALLADLTRPQTRRFRKVALAVGGLALVAGALVGGYALRSHDEEINRPPVTVFDPKTLTSARGIEWLTTALERGQLGDALDKYDMAAALAQQSNEATLASTARSAGALVLALQGHLDQARGHLHDADVAKLTDPTALGYADLATAAVAHAAGDLDVALAHSGSCGTELATTAPELAAMCFELQGETAADRGDSASARNAYSEGLALAKRVDNTSRTITLDLAIAALDLDDGQIDAVVAKATELQARAAERGAASPEGHAWLLLARAHLAQAASQQALADVEHVKLDAIETFSIRLEGRIVRGKTDALLGDPDGGLQQLDAARAEADTQGYVGLALAARLARVETMIALSTPDAVKEQRALVTDARARGYGRIAHLAETVAQR
jgi:hypothetical protein